MAFRIGKDTIFITYATSQVESTQEKAGKKQVKLLLGRRLSHQKLRRPGLDLRYLSNQGIEKSGVLSGPRAG